MRGSLSEPPAHLLGISVGFYTRSQLTHLVARLVDAGKQTVVANHNLHSAYLFHHDPAVCDFYRRARFAHIDGMALVLVGRMLGYPFRREHRVTYIDWIYPLLARAEAEQWNVFYVGSAPTVLQRGTATLAQHFPKLNLAAHHGYFDVNGAENNQVLDAVAGHATDVLLVGMGMPRQEHWILRNQEKLAATVILHAGACMDLVAGELHTPPRWMGRAGVEWVYRLATHPRRVWRRYLVEPWFLLPYLLRDLHRQWRQRRG